MTETQKQEIREIESLLEIKKRQMADALKSIKTVKIVRFVAYNKPSQEIFINQTDDEINQIITDVCETFQLVEIIDCIPTGIRNTFMKKP